MLRPVRIVTLIAVLAAAIAVTGGLARAAGPAAAPDDQPAGISGPLTLVSTSSAGVRGNNHSYGASISSDGSMVAFESGASNLDPADTDFTFDVFVKDLATGALTLASTDATGTKGNGDSSIAQLAAAGGAVAFQSESTNLDPADADTTIDVYVKDLVTGDLTLASTSDAGIKGNGVSGGYRQIGIGSKGNRVVFTSTATNLDPGDGDSTDDVYLKKLGTGDLVLLSTSLLGVKGNNPSRNPSLSKNGKRVAFESSANNLHPSDPDTFVDVYVKTIAGGAIGVASSTSTGVKGNRASSDPTISGNGNKVAFLSTATNLDPGDTDIQPDAYVKNIISGKLTLVSTSDDGVKANAQARLPLISGNGKRVTFASEATNLDPSATDGLTHMYVKDLATGDLSVVDATPDGTLRGELFQTARSIDGGGDGVAFDSFFEYVPPVEPTSWSDVYVKHPFLCDTIGTAGDDVLTGTNDPEVICGRGGDDTIEGLSGDDVLYGEEGDDTLLGGGGEDGLDGGADTDIVDYSSLGEGVIVNLGADESFGGEALGDHFGGIEDVLGTDFADELTGDAGDNRLFGMADDDVLAGAGGADELDGSFGTDVLDYGASPAAVTIDLSLGTASGGDAGGDSFTFFEGAFGSAFDDTLTGDAGDNVFRGGGGGDTIDGAGGSDLVGYVDSPAAVHVDLLNATASGGEADGDVLVSIESIGGTLLADVLKGNDDPNSLFGLDGDDQLTGRGGSDVLLGGAGMDTFSGGGGTDTCDDVPPEIGTGCEI
jgi:Tol biopolymer transport system component